LPRRILNRLEIDQAVFFAMASRGWQFLAGPITVVLIGLYFSGEVQGYYYTFWSLIALQTIFEFSFQPVIVNFASHEWGQLAQQSENQTASSASSARQHPATSRLSSLLRGSLLWYGVAAILFFLVIGTAGFFFFAQGESSQRLSWKPAWWALVGLTAVNFWTVPFLAILEGCGQVRSVYRLQFARAVLGNLAVWALIPLGAELWVTVAVAAVKLLCEIFWLICFHSELLRTLISRPTGERVNWRLEVWPFQWRIGFKGLLGFLNTALMNPVVFFYHGEVSAGQFGMTWQIFSSLEAACMSWIRPRTATFGNLIARREFAELDRIYFRLLSISSVFLALGATSLFGLILLLNYFEIGLAERLLAPLPTAMLAVAIVVLIVLESQWVYIHAHKRSPHLALATLGALLSGLVTWWLGRQYGAIGVSAAYLLMTTGFYLPLWTAVWRACRVRWHQD
jgi:O-antigen/teichoic acid export membrane protein